MRDDGTIDVYVDGNIETCTYTINGNNMVVTSQSMGELNCTFSENGTEVYNTELATNFVLGNESIVADKDYIYTYEEELGGYEVQCIDKTKSEYGAIKTGINGIDTVKLIDKMFDDGVSMNTTLVCAPQIPDSVTIIGERVFHLCLNLTYVTIGDGVTSIGDSAFYGCNSLTNIVIPDSVTNIGDYTFNGCSNLTNVTIPNSVTNIGNSAFRGCTSLTSVTIPDGVTSIGERAFCNCLGLTSMTHAGTIAQWNAIAKGFDWNYDVPATYVQCSDGQVAL
jgi:hypothetical protein